MTETIQLRFQTAAEWAEAPLADFDHFLIDHAAAEKKASGMAMSMALRYKDKAQLVKEMIDLSIEELQHFRACVEIIQSRGLQLLPDEKDDYVNHLRGLIRHGKEEGLLDRLVVGGIVEARGCERFSLIEKALPVGDMKTFYAAITASEEQHQGLFVRLAERYFPKQEVDDRLDWLLDKEAEIVSVLPHRATLH